MAETKIYNVSYKLTGNAQEFTNQLIALEQIAKSAAASVQGIATNMANTFATGSDKVFGPALQKAMGAHGKEMGEAFLQSVKDNAQKGANSYVSELAKRIQKNKANSIKLTPTIVENAKALVEKSIQGLGAFKIQVSPVVAPQSGVELQKQLDKIANLKVNVRASVFGVDKKTSKGYSYVPETSPSRMARNFKNLVSSSWMPTDAKGKPIMPKTTVKASQPSVNVQVRANMEGVAKQVGVGMTEIQKLVNQKSMLLPIRPLMGEAAEQISIGIGKIQDIARTKPISIPVQASIDKLNAQIKAFTPNATIKIPPQLKASALNSQIKAFVPSSKIRIESKFDTAGLNSQIRAYTPSSKIKIEGKLDTAGLKSQIKAFEPKSKIRIEGKLYTAGLNAQIKAFTPSSKVRVGSSFDSSGLNSSIKAFKPKSKITLEGQLDTANLDAQIKSFKPKNKITVYAELGWGKGKSSSKSQVANLQNALKPVTLEVNANIDKALEQLRRLRATALSMSPLNIGANVSGNANKGTKNSIGGITKGSPQTALTPQNIATHIGRQLDTRIERQKSAGNDFYARTRRATYPFTGNTSFGARTPMAIEMAKGTGMMFAVSSAMQMVTNSFHQVAEYENMMKTVRAILEINDGGKNFGGRFKRMEDTIRMVGRETKFTAPEVAGAARFMAMAGLGIDDINAATSPIANLALVGDNDMSMTADKMTNIMTSFGLLKGLSSLQKKANMRHTSDVLTNTFVKSNTDLVQLAEAMQYAGPMSHLTGTALEDASAMVGIMGNAGIQSSMAGTTLRMMYQNIIKPNKKQQKEWERLGIKRTDENGRIRDIFDILQDLRAKITGTRDLNSKIGKDQLKDMGAEVMSLFRTTAGAGTAALLENLGEAMALAKSNREADGIAERIAEEKKNTISGLWAQVTSTFTDQSVDTVSAFQNTIKDMLRGLRDWLASKEAAETLKDIYDVGSSILEVFSMVAKAWRRLLSVFGGALKYFMAFQVFATQFGYFMLPFTQLIGVVSSLKNGIMGLAGALGMVNTASKGATGAFTRNAIANTAISRIPVYGRNGDSAMIPGSNMQKIYSEYSNKRSGGEGNKAQQYLYAPDVANAERKKAIFENAERRHKNRDMSAISMIALARGWGLRKGGGAMKTGSVLGAAFTSGRAAGTFAMPRVWLALRTGLLYLVKLFGMLLSPVSLVIAALGGLSFGIYKAIDAIQVHKEELDKANKSAAEFAKRQTEMNGKYNKRASELGGFGMISVGYSGETEDKGVSISLKENESANAVKDLKKSTASEIFNKWVKPRAINLPSELVNSFLKNNNDYITFNDGGSGGYSLFAEDVNYTPSEKSRDKAKSLALAAIWGEELIQQSWVQKAAEDLQDAIKSNDYRKKYEILKAYEVKSNMPRISSLSSDQAFEITNPEKYYEPMKAVYDFLERIAGMSSPLIQSAEAMKKIEALAKEKNIQYTNPLFQSMTRNALSAYSFKVPWISSPMQMMFDRRGMIDWATMAQRYNEKGKAFTTGQKSAILTEAYQAMAKDPNLTKIPGISDLLRTYLPLIANTRFTFRPGDTGGVHIGDRIDANEWEEPLRQWYTNSGEYTGGKSFDKFFKDKKWMTDKNLGRINNWWMKHNGGGGSSSLTGIKTTPPPSASDQSAYENKYNKGMARPTQIVFNMDQLCKFDHTQVASPQQKDVAESVGKQMAIGLQQLFAQAVAEFGTIGQEGA